MTTLVGRKVQPSFNGGKRGTVNASNLTDTKYDPKDRPFVPHDEETALLVEHIEK
jgi:hypothetical protein